MYTGAILSVFKGMVVTAGVTKEVMFGASPVQSMLRLLGRVVTVRRCSRQWWSCPLSALALLVTVVVSLAQGADIEGTLMFLHVWKCGGTSLRQLVCDWADSEDLSWATVAGCRSLSLQVWLAVYHMEYSIQVCTTTD